MDFVLSPYGGAGIEVPLLSSEIISLDTVEWSKYSKRSSFVDADGNLDITRSKNQIASFVQTWLYFGLLSALGDTIIDGRGFSTTGRNCSAIIDSELVVSALVDNRFSLLRLPKSDRKLLLQRHATLLVEASKASQWLESHFIEDSSDLLELIFLSVRILMGTIVRSYEYVPNWDMEENHEVVETWYCIIRRQSNTLGIAKRALRTKMIDNGWCVHQAHKILSKFDYQTSYFFARLPRLNKVRVRHDYCTKKSCKGWDSKPGATLACHETEDCTCSTISVSSREVAKIIENNRIPLVSIEEDNSGQLVIKLHTMKSSSKYIAISHVWADGLGNAFENGLPECQLRRLVMYLREISKNQQKWRIYPGSKNIPLFWMDTLCIPVQGSTSRTSFSNDYLANVKRKAIDKMTIVYSCCTHTLVLDAEMRKLSVSVDDPTKLAYSQFCGWTTRSWTLQEGCLPPSIVFALSDGIYSDEAKRFSDEIQRHFLMIWVVIRALLLKLGVWSVRSWLCRAPPGGYTDVIGRCFQLPVFRDIWQEYLTLHSSVWRNIHSLVVQTAKPSDITRKYTKIWNELLDRSSSQPADIPAIFANLLGVSACEVLQRETEEARVAFIIRQQSLLPVGILSNTGPRLQRNLHKRKLTITRTLQPREYRTESQDVSEENIGLLDMSESCPEPFKNGWVPAHVDGDPIRELHGAFYLEVLEQCLRLQGDAPPSLITTTENSIGSAFRLKLSAPADSRTTSVFIERIINSETQTVHESPGETILGHCFLVLDDLECEILDGDDFIARGAHFVIIDRSEHRLTTRYCDPIRISRSRKNRERQIPGSDVNLLPEIEGAWTREFIDIVYDADDLGPKLSSIPRTPLEISQVHTLNLLMVYFMHGGMTLAMLPLNSWRTMAATVGSAAMPAIVYGYQIIIVGGAARRLFLEPIKDRGRLSKISSSWKRGFEHYRDTIIVHPWAVLLSGLVFEAIFWSLVKGSEGSALTFNRPVGMTVFFASAVATYLDIGLERGFITRPGFRVIVLVAYFLRQGYVTRYHGTG